MSKKNDLEEVLLLSNKELIIKEEIIKSPLKDEEEVDYKNLPSYKKWLEKQSGSESKLSRIPFNGCIPSMSETVCQKN